MNPLTPAPLLAARSWVHRNLLLLLIVVAVLTDLGFIAYSYYAGRARQLEQSSPALLKAREVKRLQQAVEALAIKQAQSQRRADSAYARARAPEQDAARRQVIITHLTTRYHALSTDSIRPAAADVAAYLQHYRPGPDADL